MPEQNELATITVRLHKNGDLSIDEDGLKVIIGHYDRNSGHLEFTTKEYSVKLYQQAVSVIGTVNKGKDESGLVISRMSVKERAPYRSQEITGKPAWPAGW